MGNRYNFVDGHNKDVKDKAPDWMNDLFNNKIEKKQPVIINDLYGNNKNKVNTCSVCGKILVDSSSNKCNHCKNL